MIAYNLTRNLTDEEWEIVQKYMYYLIPEFNLAGPKGHGEPIVTERKIQFNGGDGRYYSTFELAKYKLEQKIISTNGMPYTEAILLLLYGLKLIDSELVELKHPQYMFDINAGLVRMLWSCYNVLG